MKNMDKRQKILIVDEFKLKQRHIEGDSWRYL